MIETFTAKVPITYTESIRTEQLIEQHTTTIGYLYTPNVLKSMAEQRERTKELLKK